MTRRRTVLRTASALIGAVAILLTLAAGAHAVNSPTAVTFSFDDGLTSQYTYRSVLAGHRAHATYYVSSNKVGTSGRMTWTQLRDLADAGNEIGGHTLDDRTLTSLSSGDARTQVCDDRTAIAGRGYLVRNFAYPGGATNATVKGIVRDCGYETARVNGGLDYGDPCCVFAEPLPLPDAMRIRALQPNSSTTLFDFTDAIDWAQRNGGGWLVFVLHDLCAAPCSGAPSTAVSTDTFDDVLDWIDTQTAVTVKSAAEVTGPPADRTAPTVSLTAPADRATVSSSVSLTASASDDVGVDRVDFLVDGSVVGSDSSSPYEYSWNSDPKAGRTVSVTAKAYDRATNSTTSSAASVTVRAITPPASPTTYVTLGFDDGLSSQYAFRSILGDHGVHGTYFLNSNKVGSSGYMTWTQVRALADAGHEIGGHTLDHRSLTTLSEADARTQVCDDRAALVTQGYAPAAFAYPSGLFNNAVKAIVSGCGYTTARTTGGLDYPSCCVYSEWMPPKVPMAVRAFEPRLNTALSVYQDLITRAHDSGGGWVDLVLHGVCSDPCTGADDYDISATTLDDLLDWIDTQPEVVVRNTAEVLAAGDRTRPYATLDWPLNGGTVTGTVTLAADAVDNIAVDHVDFLVDGVVVATDRTAPYQVNWNSAGAASPARIEARAVDAAGNSYTTTASTVTVR